jgi:hypothetical protein
MTRRDDGRQVVSVREGPSRRTEAISHPPVPELVQPLRSGAPAARCRGAGRDLYAFHQFGSAGSRARLLHRRATHC